MNTFSQLGGVELWQLAGWTMLHFAWIGSAIGVAAFVCWFVTRRAPANVRYAVALGCLCMLAGTPGGVAAWLVVHGFSNSVRDDAQVKARNVETVVDNVTQADLHPRISSNTAHESAEASPTEDPATIPSHAGLPAIPMTAMNGHLSQQFASALEPCVRFLPWMWLIGAPLTFILLTTGVVGAERLRRASRIITAGPIVEACDRLMQAMRVTRRVAVAVCERVAAPVLVGIVRPIILIPPAALTCWSVDEIEMVLLHELAHVRRWDNLVNLGQRIIESLLFFHPAVWLVSSWVRREREACCDAVVVGRTARPHAYAELLVALAAQMPRSVLFHPAASSAMAAGPLRGRIRRILQLEDDPMLVSGKSFVLLVGSAVVAATLALLYLPARGQAKESAPATGVQEIVAEGAEISVTNDKSRDALTSDAPTGDARLEIKSQDGKTIVADLKNGQLRLTADPQSDDAQPSDNHAASAKHRFPALDDQKQADLAYRRLGGELEPIGESDLKRVQALGFDGGLVFTSGVLGRTDFSSGDILVGLHVWPTTSMKDLADVLRRDDLAELNPLKFYIVRHVAAPVENGGGRGGYGAAPSGVQEKDVVVTGRIPVNLAERGSVLKPRGTSVAPAGGAASGTIDTSTNPVAAEAPVLTPLGSTHLLEPKERRLAEAAVDEALKSDPNMSILNQQLMQATYALSTLHLHSVGKSGESKEADRLQKQIAGIQKQIGDYRSQQMQRLSAEQSGSSVTPMPIMPAPANPSTAMVPTMLAPANPYGPSAPARPTIAPAAPILAEVPNAADAPRGPVLVPTLPAAPSSTTIVYTPRTDIGPRAEQMLARRIERATKRRDEAMKDLDDAKKQLLEADKGGDKNSVLAAKPEYDAAIQEYMDAKRALNDLKLELAEPEDELQIDGSGVESRQVPGPPTQSPPAGNPFGMSPPTPTHVMPAAGAVRVGSKWLAEEVAADRKIADLRQQLMAAETELQIKSADAGSVDSESVEKLQKQIAELQLSMAEQAQKKKVELLTGQQAALDNAAKQAAEAMAKAQIELERAASDHEELVAKEPMGAVPQDLAKLDMDTTKRLEVAKRAFEQRKRAVEAIKQQFAELQRQREATTVQQAQAKQQAERGQREAGDAKREAEAERREVEAEAKQQAEERSQQAEEAQRETEKEAKVLGVSEAYGLRDPESDMLSREVIDVEKAKSDLDAKILQTQTDFAKVQQQLKDPQMKLPLQSATKVYQIQMRMLAQNSARLEKRIQDLSEQLQKRTGKSLELTAEDARREMDESKREAEDERRQADAERREAEEEARREQEEARREAEEVKREAEDASREAEQEKRNAEQAERSEQPERPERPEQPEKLEQRERAERERVEAKPLITADGKQQVTVIYKQRPSAGTDGQPDAGRQMLEQLHRQLEEMDRQLEATKRQLQVLVEQKEAIVAHAEKLAKEIEQQNDGKQKP